MEIATLFGSLTDSVKAIEIELSLEGLVVVLVEVLASQSGFKLGRVVNFEGCPTFRPRHNILKALFFGIFQHGIELQREKGWFIA